MSALPPTIFLISLFFLFFSSRDRKSGPVHTPHPLRAGRGAPSESPSLPQLGEGEFLRGEEKFLNWGPYPRAGVCGGGVGPRDRGLLPVGELLVRDQELGAQESGGDLPLRARPCYGRGCVGLCR